MLYKVNVCRILQKDLSQPLKMESVDSSSGILFPYYDHDTGVMFIAGKVNNHQQSLYYGLVWFNPL